MEARAIENGRIELEWLYDPRYEEYGPRAAYEARIYWDAATGTIDYSAPKATVHMGGRTSTARYSWESEPLINEQECLFVVRVATAAWPEGIEIQSTDEHAATLDSDIPATPALTVEVL